MGLSSTPDLSKTELREAYRQRRIDEMTAMVAELESGVPSDITEGQRKVRVKALRDEIDRLQEGGVP